MFIRRVMSVINDEKVALMINDQIGEGWGKGIRSNQSRLI
jgi:hypothetical protein